MKRRPERLSLTVEEAVDNISTIMEMEPNASLAMGLVEGKKIVIGIEDFSSDAILWLGPDSMDILTDVAKVSYSTIHKYLEAMYKNPETPWEDEKTRKGIQSLMLLVGEAAHNFEEYLKVLSIKDPRRSLLQSVEYKRLQEYYLQKITKKLPFSPEGKEEWQEEWKDNDEGVIIDLDMGSSVDFESLRRDQEYELFYIHNDEEKPFFTHQLLRNVKLVCDFDEEALEMEDDPLLQIRYMKDKDLQASAKQIIKSIKADIQKFYKLKVSIWQHELASLIHKALLALMLSSNPRNLIAHTHHKNCIEYFSDFYTILRRCLICHEYQQFMAYPERIKTPQDKAMVRLIQRLCKALFFRVGGIKEEMLGFIYRLIRKGEEKSKKKTKKSPSLWTELIEVDEKIRKILSMFPSGPLCKDLDVLRAQESEYIYFDPLIQDNLPSYKYELSLNDLTFGVLHLPSPTRQHLISKASIAWEFACWMRCNLEEKQNHLMINLQDRSSWKEAARCHALEEMSLQAEYRRYLRIVSLNKNTPFYNQRGQYLNIQDAKEFISSVKEELTDLHNLAYYYLRVMKDKNYTDFVAKLIDFVHKEFFEGKKQLVRSERQNFIEIVYHFIVLKVIDLVKPETISFTCKDSLDTGAAMTGSFYGFYHLLKGTKWQKKEKDFLLYLFYAPALVVRERPIDSTRLFRALAFLSCIEEAVKKNRANILKEMKKLFGFSL